MPKPYTAAADFVRRIQQFAQSQRAGTVRIVYETKPDEQWDLTKAARRVYGDPDEWLAIMAAAFVDSPEHPMTPRTLVLPTRDQLAAIKLQTGYTTDPFDFTAADLANPVLSR